MSSLLVQPVSHDDVAQCIAIRVDSLGSLVIGRPPAYPGYVEESEAKILRELDTVAHVHHLKVVTTPKDKTEVLAYAKWEIYSRGRPDLEALREPTDQADKAVDGYGALRVAAHEYFSSRNGEMGKSPHIRKNNNAFPGRR